MACYACGSGGFVEILRKGDVHIWTDTCDADSMGLKYECILHQCKSCGHVYQPVDNNLRNIFNRIYRSRNAQGPSPMGIGKWGLERANTLFFNEIDLTKHRTAIEIGCGDGYLLKSLRMRGFERLFGIEPSPNVDRGVDGITFINEFVNGNRILDEKVDLIYSIAVFEHIEDINSVLQFCRNNIRPHGELFVVVPNAQRQLESGDPALFVHQHVHYFTESSLRNVLRQNGFQVSSISSRKDGLSVSARPVVPVQGPHPTGVMFYNRYQEELNCILKNIAHLISEGAVLVHGACNAMNNIVGWIGGDFDLVDNDENKQGRTYFGEIVLSPQEIDLERYKTVLVIPTAYYEEIKEGYLSRGFKGHIVGATK